MCRLHLVLEDFFVHMPSKYVIIIQICDQLKYGLFCLSLGLRLSCWWDRYFQITSISSKKYFSITLLFSPYDDSYVSSLSVCLSVCLSLSLCLCLSLSLNLSAENALSPQRACTGILHGVNSFNHQLVFTQIQIHCLKLGGTC